jgi:hypothetical protein
MMSWMEVLVLLFRSPLWPKFSMSSWVEQDVPQPLPCWAGRGRSKRRQLHYGPSLFWQQDSHSSLALFQVISYRPNGKSTRTGESIKGFLKTFSGGVPGIATPRLEKMRIFRSWTFLLFLSLAVYCFLPHRPGDLGAPARRTEGSEPLVGDVCIVLDFTVSPWGRSLLPLGSRLGGPFIWAEWQGVKTTVLKMLILRPGLRFTLYALTDPW